MRRVEGARGQEPRSARARSRSSAPARAEQRASSRCWSPISKPAAAGRERRQQRLAGAATPSRHSRPRPHEHQRLGRPPPRSGRGSRPRPDGPSPRPARSRQRPRGRRSPRGRRRRGRGWRGARRRALRCEARCRPRAVTSVGDTCSTSCAAWPTKGRPSPAYQERAVRALAELALQLPAAGQPEQPQQLALADGGGEIRALQAEARSITHILAADNGGWSRVRSLRRTARLGYGERHEAHARRVSRATGGRGPHARRRARDRVQARELRARRQAVRGHRRCATPW